MKNRIIVLEGLDGAGKTTIANRIKDENPDLNFEIVHCTRHTPNNKEYFCELLRTKRNIIFDRFCYGQWIYQNNEERVNNKWLDLSSLEYIEGVMKELKVEVKYVYSDIDTCLYNCKRDEQDSYYTKEYLEDLDRRYRYFFEHISSMNIEYIYNDYHPAEGRLLSAEDRTKLAQNFDYSSLPEVIAVDFDGCLATDCFPNIDKAVPNINLINKLKEKQKTGTKIILWTCRTDNSLIQACNFLADQGFYPDAVNENIKEVKDKLDGGPVKVWASVYLDDKAEKVIFSNS